MDSAQFALGMEDFDVTLHQPQPPGYFLYVMAAKLLNFFIGDHNTSLIALSIICAGFAAAFVFSFADRLFGRRAAWFASLAFIASPSMWLHSDVALSYMPEAMMSVLVAMYCHTAITKRGQGLVTAAVLLGISGGIRQSSMVFLLPMFLYAAYRSGVGRGVKATLVLGLTTAAWAVPMIYATGGLGKYLAYMDAHWRDSNWHGISLGWTLYNAKYMSYYILSGLGLVTVPLLAWLVPPFRCRVFRDNTEGRMFLLWLLPAILFHLIIFTHPAVPGHSLIYVVGLIVLGSGVVDGISKRVSNGSRVLYRRTTAAFTAATAVAGTLMFFATGYSISYTGIRTHDRILESYIEAIRQNFSPDDTEIVGSSRFMYSFRQAMYYLPDFRVHGDEVINAPQGPRIFYGYRLQTYREPCITFRPTTRRVVDFINHPFLKTKQPPPGAKVLATPDGPPLLYYDDLRYLRQSKRIAPHLCGGHDAG